MTRYSYNTWNHSVHWGLPATLPEQIAATAAAGYDYIGLDLPSVLAHEAAGVSVEELRAQLDQAGIAAFEIAPFTVGGPQTQQNLRDLVRVGPILGAVEVLAVVRERVGPAEVAIMKRGVQELAEHGMHTSIEFLAGSPVDSIRAALDLIEAVGLPLLRIDLDSWHFLAGPSTWPDLDALPGELIGFVQFGDRAKPITESLVYEFRHRRVLPGEGVDDLQRFCDVVMSKVADPTVSVEILSDHWRAQPPARLIEQTLSRTRRFWEGQSPSVTGIE